jgi:predicted AAA+ superfamily ATPase
MADKNYIERNKYFDRIQPFINNNIVKVITGQRGVGKTYFLFQLIDFIKNEYPRDKVILINKELEEFYDITNHHELLNYVKDKANPGKEKVFLFIDEIHDIHNFEIALGDLLAMGAYDIYITGSNADFLSGLSTFFAGRYMEFHLQSLSYQEFLVFHELENDETSLMKYIKYGGLPFLINLELKDEVVFEYLNGIYSSIILKDIVTRYQIRNIFPLHNINRFLADHLGNLLSAKSVSDFLKSQKLNYSPKVIIHYLTYLANAFFIHKIKRASLKDRKIFEVNVKYYFDDLGLRHTVRRYTENDITKVIENLVYKHLVYCGYEVFVGQLGKKEIDFWCEKKGNSIYVQVVHLITDEAAQDKVFGSLLDLKDNYPKYVVSMDPAAGEPYHGINHLHILEFLTTDL